VTTFQPLLHLTKLSYTLLRTTEHMS